MSFAALLIEICYTRVISFKLFYYYTYLVIGLALLGIGSGGVMVAVSQAAASGPDRHHAAVELPPRRRRRGRQLRRRRIHLARLAVDLALRSRPGPRAWGELFAICLFIFVPFVAPGVIIATLFGRRPEGVGGLYFADLVGAGLACAVVIYLTGIHRAARRHHAGGRHHVLRRGFRAWAHRARRRSPLLCPGRWSLARGARRRPRPVARATPRHHQGQLHGRASPIYSAWSPIFRVDAVQASPDVRALYHDGIIGSAIYRWNGQRGLARPLRLQRRSPVHPLRPSPRPLRAGRPSSAPPGGTRSWPRCGSAASTSTPSSSIPVTYSLVKTTFAGFDGHLAQDPAVNYVNADGRSFMARSHQSYDLIWYPAPDSYAATNAATASAFVLSESYLYTTNAIVDSLQHLTPDGIFVAQFGEIDYQHKPYRTTRFVATARQALAELGVPDPGAITSWWPAHPHTSSDPLRCPPSSSNELPFTPGRGEPLRAPRCRTVPGTTLQYAPGHRVRHNPVDTVVTSSPAQLRSFYAVLHVQRGAHHRQRPLLLALRPLRHRPARLLPPHHEHGPRRPGGGAGPHPPARAGHGHLGGVPAAPLRRHPMDWRRLPRKGCSALFFASVGFGFMFFEITLMQLLNLFLGYPTYALTVTLMSHLDIHRRSERCSAREAGASRRRTVPSSSSPSPALTASTCSA